MSVTGNPDHKWTTQLSTTGVTQSAPVKVPAWINEFTMALDPNGTTAGMQLTCSDEANIDGATAVWFDWDPGVVTAKTVRATVGPVTGVRINQTIGAGTSTVYLCGQRPRV